MNEPPTGPPRTILQAVGQYYADRLERFGPTPRGVDWNSAESQELRFSRLLEVVTPPDGPEGRSILDVGCGYGALLDHLRARGMRLDYRGFDVSVPMIAAAQARHAGVENALFSTDVETLHPATYAVASGIFNVKLSYAVEPWRGHVLDTLARLHRWSTAGFAFNLLSTYSDPDRRRDDLFYADPGEILDVCMRRFSSRVVLLHDYPLFEFTVVVRK